VTDPAQSIRILESLDPTEDEYNDDELLSGTTKAGGMMHFKLRADAAILQQIDVSFSLYKTSPLAKEEDQ